MKIFCKRGSRLNAVNYFRKTKSNVDVRLGSDNILLVIENWGENI